ncbi:glycosyltransferase [Myroides sp. NP-2]|uniref:glycosyltransferase n=1 Tax=Myroides sp. NP-2 TaxID=2759945 RepID=UPI0015F9C8E7|nr:glycosyltransferase [Myroides sp. NP-2]MBB1149741.1 glycosyltransferase [Myroides sp. NP-2]
MIEKLRILIFIPHFEPGFKFGGPIRSIKALINLLNNKIQFTVFTSNHDYGDKVSYSNIMFNKVLRKDDYDIIYYSGGFIGILMFIKNNYRYDTIYLNSFFHFRYSIWIIFLKKLRLINNKIVLSPRGEFNEGALNIRRIKKKLFLYFSKGIHLYKNIVWHATTNEEVLAIESIFGDTATIKYAPVLPSAFAFKKDNDKSIVKKPCDLKLVFLSRISKIKNLDYLLTELFLISNEVKDTKANIVLDVFGPISDVSFWNECKCIIEANKSNNIKVTYKGEVEYEEVFGILRNYHYWVLPTLGENYGQAIADSLVANCPIIISDKTPWTEDVKRYNLGFVIELKEHFLKDVILECLNFNNDEYANYRCNVKSYIDNHLSDEDSIEKNLNIFLDEN